MFRFFKRIPLMFLQAIERFFYNLGESIRMCRHKQEDDEEVSRKWGVW